MATTALRQERFVGIVVPIATLAITGIAIAPRAVGDNALALLLGFFLIVYSALVLLKRDSLRIKPSGWRPPWQWAPPEALLEGFPPSQGLTEAARRE